MSSPALKTVVTKEPASRIGRATVKGRFLFAGDEKLFVRGVTYGPFGPDGTDREYPDLALARRDFAQMAEAGVNAIRTYSVPPLWLLDLAGDFGLRVMVGLSWSQHVTFLDDPTIRREIIERVRTSVRTGDRHPAILCYAIGNEIPSSIVRWHGPAKIERFLHALYETAKSEDDTALITYANYPTTEYLQLPFLDLVSFNVYLNSTTALAGYLNQLLNFAGDRPLVVSEIGMDSRRNGLSRQAKTIEEQVGAIIDAGCAGTFLFSWTDEWHRGGASIDDWDFGLTQRDRAPKPALAVVSRAFREGIESRVPRWPRVSIVLCSYNGQRHIEESLAAIGRLDYPDFEVIVVDDGSTDQTAAIASRHDVRLIRTENRGLSAARNTGLHAATGEIVAYIDDDAYPDREWLKRLAMVFLRTDYAGVGGPNIPPEGDCFVAQCVALAPGGPIHVLLTDTEAEHIPGCNMAFRRAELLEIGGFDPRFRTAGDDVDVCWRIQQQGWKLGFTAAATVFHHRRGSVRTYWKQQVGYGRAEAMLERKWPEKYNAAGYLSWAGRIYNAAGLSSLSRGRIYHGTWGSAAYQRLYAAPTSFFDALPLLPEWYLVIAFLAALSVVGLVWNPLLLAAPLFAVAAGLPVVKAVMTAWRLSYSTAKIRAGWWKALALIAGLHLLHPLARLVGRFKFGLHPWRPRGATRTSPRFRRVSIWTEKARTAEEWLSHFQAGLRSAGNPGLAGGEYDNWDLEVQGGLLGAARTRMAVEEHGNGRQMLRFRIWPRYSRVGLFTTLLLLGLGGAAAYDAALPAAAILFGAGAALGVRILYESASAMHNLTNVLEAVRHPGIRREAPANPVPLSAVARNS
ncbi:MAG TPA: glycosyltransferase [Terriglobia bacterium]|nr:glycosyltransferase [Terriglobia bacterium]